MNNNSKRQRVVIFVVVIIVAIGGFLLVAEMHPVSPAQVDENTGDDLVPVSVVSVSPEAKCAHIRALGEVTPEWTTTISSMVDGYLVFVHPRLRNGEVLSAGETIVRIDDTRYAAELADARSTLAAAMMQLQQVESEEDEARLQWERSGRSLEDASPLALKHPQIETARAAHAAAAGSVEFAERLLVHADVTMPYAGVVLESHVAPGTAVSAGSPIATVAATGAVEIGVALDARQWRLLEEELVGTEVRIVDPESSARWTATVDRVDETYETASRQRSAWIRVERPLTLDPPLRAGLFVAVEIPGRVLDHVLTIPESALTPDGLVWFVDEADRLVSVVGQPLFYDDGDISIAVPEGLLRRDRGYVVAGNPNGAFVNGLEVRHD